MHILCFKFILYSLKLMHIIICDYIGVIHDEILAKILYSINGVSHATVTLLYQYNYGD